MKNYVIASSKDWFNKHPKSSEYKKLSFFYIKDKEALNLDDLGRINPRYIFFPHWSWKVDEKIFKKYECIVFHTAPLPYGRGGSPIQNLILKGYKESPVYALKMNEILDSGPFYDYQEISLKGNLNEIFSRLAFSIEKMILNICKMNPIPIEQVGEVKNFKRLNYKDNELKKSFSLEKIYNHIRMVDGDDYKKAYINFGGYKIEFYDANLENNQLNAKVRILKENDITT